MGTDAGDSGPSALGAHASRQHRPWALALFVLPVAAVLVPALYNRIHPELAGVPFFIWYQFMAVIFGALVTGVVYLLRGTEKRVTRTQASPLPSEPPATA
jgi:hypothetical protein